MDTAEVLQKSRKLPVVEICLDWEEQVNSKGRINLARTGGFAISLTCDRSYQIRSSRNWQLQAYQDKQVRLFVVIPKAKIVHKHIVANLNLTSNVIDD
jgi:hypothetical protein